MRTDPEPGFISLTDKRLFGKLREANVFALCVGIIPLSPSQLAKQDALFKQSRRFCVSQLLPAIGRNAHLLPRPPFVS